MNSLNPDHRMAEAHMVQGSPFYRSTLPTAAVYRVKRQLRPCRRYLPRSKASFSENLYTPTNGVHFPMICQVYFSVDENGDSTTGSRRVVGSAADKFIHSSSVIDN